MRNINILNVLSSYGKASGGHYRSCRTIGEFLNEQPNIAVSILSIGKTISPVLKESTLFLGLLRMKWYWPWVLNKHIAKIIREKNINVVHCYDGGSYLILILLPALRRIPIVYTKCGGANENKKVVQYAPDVVLFSHENLSFHQSNRRLRDANLNLISNRVRIDVGSADIAPLLTPEVDRSSYELTLLRICRIGKHYQESVRQTINLAAFLKDRGVKLRTIVIGVNETNSILEDLRAYASSKDVSVFFITDKKYTENAARFIPQADFVLATGRGLMEASAEKKVLFCPNKNSDLPALVNQVTIDELAKNNFSPRSQTNLIWTEVEQEVLELADNESSRLQYGKMISAYAEERFILNQKVIDRYLSIYNRVITNHNKKAAIKRITRNVIGILYYLDSFRRAESYFEN